MVTSSVAAAITGIGELVSHHNILIEYLDRTPEWIQYLNFAIWVLCFVIALRTDKEVFQRSHFVRWKAGSKSTLRIRLVISA